MSSAIDKRLKVLEALLADRLAGPTIHIWLNEGQDIASIREEMIAAGTISATTRIKVARWLTGEEVRQSPDWVEPQAVEPRAIEYTTKALTYQPAEPERESQPPAAKPPDDDRQARQDRKERRNRERFHRPIYYPRTGNI